MGFPDSALIGGQTFNEDSIPMNVSFTRTIKNCNPREVSNDLSRSKTLGNYFKRPIKRKCLYNEPDENHHNVNINSDITKQDMCYKGKTK